MDEAAARAEVGQLSPRASERTEVLLEQVRVALRDVERLLQTSPDAGPASARELAGRQAIIMAAAHEEAAEVVAAAQADAARILERAAASRSATGEAPRRVIDLREPDGVGATGPQASGAALTPPITVPELPVTTRQRLAAVDAELRAAVAATADVAQEVSSQIARLAVRPDPPGAR